MRILSWAFQILILTVGIHLFLRFVRTTRGNPLIRGLLLSVLVGVVGLWGLSAALHLEELQHVLERSTGFIVVGLAIVFQPELRRAMAQLGERAIARRLARTARADTIRKIVQAARAMAERRHGALIAFERESSLLTVAETGSEVQADVSPRLIQSIFHPGSPLHDGAVVLRKDRVAAAGAILPLSRKKDLPASVGTRHRAALGLSEETDAVVLVVSEETGSISLAREGELCVDVEPDRLEAELREVLEANGRGRRRPRSRVRAITGAVRRDFGWMLGSLLLACGAWYVAHQSIRDTREFVVRIADASEAGRRVPREGEILILPPAENVRVQEQNPDARHQISVTGSRSQFDELGGSLAGTLEIDDPAWDGGPLDLDRVRWEDPVLGLDYRWKDGAGPILAVQRFGTRRVQLEPGDLVLEGRVDPRFQARPEEASFLPSANVEIHAPLARLDRLAEDGSLALAPITLGPEDRGEVRERVRLAPHLEAAGFRFSTPVEVVVPVLPVRREAGTITKEIALVCLSPDRADELSRWSLPANAQTARFTIETSGLIPIDADPGSAALLERKTAILRFVEDSLRVYVDVAELPPLGEGRSARIRWTWRRDWQETPDAIGLDPGTLGGWEELDVRLESEPFVLLEREPAPVSPEPTETDSP